MKSWTYKKMNEIGEKKVGQMKKWTNLDKMKSWTNKRMDKIGQNYKLDK